MTERYVDLYTIGRSRRALVGDRIRMWNHVGGQALREPWNDPPDREEVAYVDHEVMRIVRYGKEALVAVDQPTVELLAPYVNDALFKRVHSAQAEIADLRMRATRAGADYYEVHTGRYLLQSAIDDFRCLPWWKRAWLAATGRAFA